MTDGRRACIRSRIEPYEQSSEQGRRDCPKKLPEQEDVVEISFSETSSQATDIATALSESRIWSKIFITCGFHQGIA